MMVEISTDFFIGSIISGFSVLTMWLYSVSGKVENIDGTLQEHLRNEKRRCSSGILRNCRYGYDVQMAFKHLL